MKKTIILLFTTFYFITSNAYADEVVTPSDFWDEFQTEPDKFREKHQGNKITISGIVADTYISVYMSPVISLVDRVEDDAKVICVLSRYDADKLFSFKKGEKIKMTGNFYAARENKVVIKQCQATN